MRLTARLLLLALVAALIPVALLGYLSYSSAKQALQEQALEDLSVIAEAKEGHLYSFLEKIKGRAIDFSSDGFIRDSTEALTSMSPEDLWYNATLRALNRHLRINKMPLDESIRMIAVIDLNGRIIAATDEDEIGRDESEDDYFIHGKKDVYVSDVHVSHHVKPGEHRYHIAVSAPLTGRETGVPIGVIVNFYDTRELDKILSGEFHAENGTPSEALKKRKTLDIYLVNKDKRLITPSRFSDGVMKQTVETLPVLECLAGRETTGIYKNYRNQEVIGASTCIPSHAWTLLVEIDTREAFAPVMALRQRVFLLGVAVAVLAFALAYPLTRRISGPVAALSRATRRLAGGDFSARAPVESKDEIGELASSFNQMAAQLAESHAKIRRLAAITESSADAILGIDLDGRVQEWNRGAERMFGYTREEMLGKKFIEMLPEELAEAEKAFFAEVVKEGFIENHESVRVHKDGRWIPVLITATTLKDEKGDLLGLSVVMKDLTEIKKLQSAIISEKTRLESLIRGVKDGVAFADAEDRVVLLNESAEKLLGIKSPDVLGKPILSCHGGRMGKVAQVLKALKEGRLKYHVSEIAFKGRDFEVTASSIKKGGEYLGTVMILRDITEKKRAERRLREYAKQLEHSNKLKELFADIMRHDLQNPVAVIKGLSGILAEEEIPEEVRQGLEKIRRNAEKLEEIIESAAKYAKLDSTEKLDFQELDLDEVLREVIKNFQLLVKEKHMKLSYVPPEKKPAKAMANPIIEEVFSNLLSNAIKYSPQGSEVTIRIEEADGSWKVAVEDRGVGIPDESKEAVFSRFQRIEKRGVKGTGLGLAIVKRITELHGGRAWVEDNPGGGSIFYVTLPRVDK